nr:LapA family protein [Pontibacterium sinense]
MFTINNTQLVTVDLVLLKLPEASLSLWLVATFILGGVLGMAISVVSVLLLRTRLRAERRRVTNAQKELDQLRTAGLKNAA